MIPKTFLRKLVVFQTFGMLLAFVTLLFSPIIFPCYMLISIPMFSWMVIAPSSKWVLCFLALFSGKMKPIQLITFQGDIHNSMAFQLPDNTWYSWVYWATQTGELYLLENGKIDEELSEVSFVNWWRPLRKSEQVQQKLSYDIPDFDIFIGLPKAKRKKLMSQAPFSN